MIISDITLSHLFFSWKEKAFTRKDGMRLKVHMVSGQQNKINTT